MICQNLGVKADWHQIFEPKNLHKISNLLSEQTHRRHGCQMAIARFLDHMCMVLWASGLWLRYAALQNLIPSSPWIAPPCLPPWRNPRKGKVQILPSSNPGKYDPISYLARRPWCLAAGRRRRAAAAPSGRRCLGARWSWRRWGRRRRTSPCSASTAARSASRLIGSAEKRLRQLLK